MQGHLDIFAMPRMDCFLFLALMKIIKALYIEGMTTLTTIHFAWFASENTKSGFSCIMFTVTG